MNFTVLDGIAASPDAIRRWAQGYSTTEEFWNDCHNKSDGHFCGKGAAGGRIVAPGHAEMLLRTIKREGGATLDFENNMAPIRSGFAVAVRPAHAAVFELNKLGRGQIQAWLDKSRSLLAQPSLHVGAWHDKATNKVWLDITRVYPNTAHGRALAMRAAGRHKQIAIFHLDALQEIEKRNAAALRAGDKPEPPTITASADTDNDFSDSGVHHTSLGRWPHQTAEFYSPTQPRDKAGKWSSYGSGSVLPSAVAAAGRSGYMGHAGADYSAVKAPSALRHRASDLYAKMPMDDPSAHGAWRSLAGEVKQQYEYMTKTLGIKVQVVHSDPYPTVKELIHDIETNHRLKVLSTASTGSHPLFSNKENDMFRAVHDFFGHAATGRDFGRHGERATYLAHAATMRNKDSVRALFTETEMQNAYLTVRGQGFGPQKIGVAPDALVFNGVSGLTAGSGPMYSKAARKAAAQAGMALPNGKYPIRSTGELYAAIRRRHQSTVPYAQVAAHIRARAAALGVPLRIKLSTGATMEFTLGQHGRSEQAQMKRRASPLSVGGKRDPSLRWPWLYDILRSKGYDKQTAAMISNSRRPMRKGGRLNVLDYKQADNMGAVRANIHKK